MDYGDEYESLNSQFRIVPKKVKSTNFFTSTEMEGDITIKKEEASDNEVSRTSMGKSIKSSRPAVYDFHSSSSSSNGPKIVKNTTRKMEEQQSQDIGRDCPICSNPAIKRCRCNNRDSMCDKAHKWHIKNGKIILGHSH